MVRTFRYPLRPTATNIFEYATRHKLRFQSTKGQLSAELLWDVPLRSNDGFDLNAVARAAHEAVEKVKEQNFVDGATSNPAHTRLEICLDVVKKIISTKLADEQAAKRKSDNKVEKERLLAILAEKQDGKLSALSEALDE